VRPGGRRGATASTAGTRGPRDGSGGGAGRSGGRRGLSAFGRAGLDLDSARALLPLGLGDGDGEDAVLQTRLNLVGLGVEGQAHGALEAPEGPLQHMEVLPVLLPLKLLLATD